MCGKYRSNEESSSKGQEAVVIGPDPRALPISKAGSHEKLGLRSVGRRPRRHECLLLGTFTLPIHYAEMGEREVIVLTSSSFVGEEHAYRSSSAPITTFSSFQPMPFSFSSP